MEIIWKLEKELAAEKERSTILQSKSSALEATSSTLKAKLKKKRKTSGLKKKLDSTELFLKDTLAQLKTIEQEKLEFDAVEAMESAGRRDVEIYKALDTFKEEVSKAAVDSYFHHFEECWATAGQLFPELDLSRLIFNTKKEAKEGEIVASEETQPIEAVEVPTPTSTQTKEVP